MADLQRCRCCDRQLVTVDMNLHGICGYCEVSCKGGSKPYHGRGSGFEAFQEYAGRLL